MLYNLTAHEIGSNTEVMSQSPRKKHPFRSHTKTFQFSLFAQLLKDGAPMRSLI